MNRLAIPEESVRILVEHLAASSPKEEGAFCLLNQGLGREGKRLLVSEVLLPPPDAWEIQESGALRPSAQWTSAAVSRAIQTRSGLLFIHSHPNPFFPSGLSPLDEDSFAALARTLAPMLDGPFAAAIAHPEGWTGVLWCDGDTESIGSIMSVGRTMRPLAQIQEAANSSLDARQSDALGVVHHRLRALSVGVVGCGGIGSPIAEQLVRMGVAGITLVDNDLLDTDSNVRRVFGSTMADLGLVVPPSKVDVVGGHLERLGMDVHIQRIKGDVKTDRVFRTLLDCDVVICGTDTHGSRATINELAGPYLLPVIDVGVRVGSKDDGQLVGLLAEVRILTPSTPCLWCRQIISADVIRAENLPEHERHQQEKEGYVVGGIGEPVPSVVALTVLASGLATTALLTLLSEVGNVAPSGYWVDGMLGDSRETEPTDPVPGCRCRQNLGRGDNAAPPFRAEE